MSEPDQPKPVYLPVRPAIAFIPGIPILWQLAGIGVVVLLLTGAVGGVVWHFHQEWYGQGYAQGTADATAKYEQLMADQRKANQDAIDKTQKQLDATADQLAKTEKDYDDALAQLDANSGGDDAASPGLSAQRMHDLGRIR